MAIVHWLALRLLCTGMAGYCGVLHDDTFCAGKTVDGSTNWDVYKVDRGIFVEINSSICGYDSVPVYVTSLAGIYDHKVSTGSSAIYHYTATGFTTYIRYVHMTAAVANSNRWHIHWFADSLGSSVPGRGACSGKTEYKNTAWQQDETNVIYVDVDTSACGFQDTPVYVTSVSADRHVWLSTGASEIYDPTPIGFRIYLHYGGVTVSRGNSWGWFVNWMADTGACSGRTVRGGTDWVDDVDGVHVDVDTSACPFQNAPVYITSLAGTQGHLLTTGSSEVYYPTATGFRIYIHSSGTTAATANANSWHVNWIARSQATTVSACTDANGVVKSAHYPCAWGRAVCEQDQLCLSLECQCQACPPGFRLTSTGCQKAVYLTAADGAPCVQLLGHPVLDAAGAIANASGTARGYVHVLRITLGAQPSEFFEALGLATALGGAPSLDSLDVESNCTQAWSVTPGSSAAFNSTSAALSDRCVLSASQSGEEVVRQGAIGVYHTSTDPARQWTVEARLEFDAAAGGVLNIAAHRSATEDAASFSSTLALHPEEQRNLLAQPYSLTIGDLVPVRQGLSSSLTLEVAIVLLSTPHEPDDSATLIQNITEQISQGRAGESEAQFTFVPGISSFASCKPSLG